MFNSLYRGLAAAANRELAAAAHMARLNQRRAMASMAKQKEEDMKNWSCDEVSWYAQTVISSKVFIDAFKAEELDGENLLDLPQNQMLVNDLVSAGLKRADVRKLAGAVRKLVAPGVSPRHSSPCLPTLPPPPRCTWIAVNCPFNE